MPMTRFEVDFDGADALDSMSLIAELNSHGLAFEKICEMSGRARFEGSLSDHGAKRAKDFVEIHLDDGQRLYATQEGETL